MKLFTSLIALVLIFIILLFIGWSRAPDLLANSFSEKMKVYDSIDDIHLSLNSVKIEGFEIRSQRGAILPKAFNAQEIGIFAPLSRYLKKEIVIDEITLDNVYLGLEFENKESGYGNWSLIMNNFKEALAKQISDKSVLIKKVTLTNISIDLVFRREGDGIQHLPSIESIVLTDISSEKGFPIDQIAANILGHMLRTIFIKQGLQNMLEASIEPRPLQFLGHFLRNS